MIRRDEARSFGPIRDAEATNSKRFEDSFLEYEADSPRDGASHVFGPGMSTSRHAERLERLKDGETIKFDDRWAVDHGHLDFFKHFANPAT